MSSPTPLPTPPSPAREEEDDVLRPRVCPRCQYALEMLPTAGVCPECGRPYDAETVYLYGYAAGVKRNAFNVRPSPWYYLVPTALFAVVLVIWERSWLAAWWVGLCGFEVVAALWQRRAAQERGAVQVKLAPNGFLQVTRRPGPFPFAHSETKAMIPWRKAVLSEIMPVDGARGRVRIRIASDDRWWTLQSTYIDAEVDVSPGQMEALHGRFKMWRRGP